jgi:hypothetical protein
MARNTAGLRAGQALAPDYYQQAPPADTRKPAEKAARNPGGKPGAGRPLPRLTAKSRLDEWMEVDFKFGGSRIKRKAVALVLLGLPAPVPLFFMLPALLTVNSNAFAVSVDDTLGTGADICLFLYLLVTRWSRSPGSTGSCRCGAGTGS